MPRVVVLGILAAVLALGAPAAAEEPKPFPIPIEGEWHRGEFRSEFWYGIGAPFEVRINWAEHKVLYNEDIPLFVDRAGRGCEIVKGSVWQYWIPTGEPNVVEVWEWVPAGAADAKVQKLLMQAVDCAGATQYFQLVQKLPRAQIEIAAMRRVAPGPYRYQLRLFAPGSPWYPFDRMFSDTPVKGEPEPFPEPKPPPPSSPDRIAPVVSAFPAAGVGGASARLQFTFWDDSGRANPELFVFHGREPCTVGDLACFKARAVVQQQLGYARATGALEHATLPLEKSLSGPLVWCLNANDVAGNLSSLACAPLYVLVPSKPAAKPLPPALKGAKPPRIGYAKGGKPAKPAKPVTPPAKKRDRTAPKVEALPAKGKRGQPVELRYTVSDASGVTQEAIVVRRGKEILVRKLLEFSRSEPGKVYSVAFTPAASLTGTLEWCVQSRDRAGNESKVDCAPLVLT